MGKKMLDRGTHFSSHYCFFCCVRSFAAGAESDIGPRGELELVELNGQPVTSVVGESPLHAWGRVLLKLGLIDEIMYLRAIESVRTSRLEGLKDAKDRLEGKVPAKSPAADKKKGASDSQPPSLTPSRAQSPVDGETKTEEKKDAEEVEEIVPDPDKEPPSERELELRSKLNALKSELEASQEEGRKVSIALANARIHDLGPFLCNPFLDEESGKSTQNSWLATAVRKEKARMGSTGNRKKVVSAVDLLERNDTFFNTDIEALIEGLPGSEFCSPYVFQAFRSGGGGGLNRAWIHEAQIRNEKEAQKRLMKKSHESMKKEAEEKERILKRKQRDELRDSKKRQKEEEEEEKKKARADERMARLEVQVNDRLYKEAAFQREKVVVSLARTLAKEFARRRKAAEIVAGQAIVELKKASPSTTSSAEPSFKTLPAPSNTYNEDAVRVWDFMSTFRSYFLEKEYVSEVPTLSSLQTAVDCIQGKATGSSLSGDDAVSLLTDLSIALCKPLAASLTRTLFASIIALNPLLQKDFGAAFFNGVNSKSGSKEDDDETTGPQAADIILPVNDMTWQEIARLSFLADALGELGQSRQDAAHFLRGYISAGHPNSSKLLASKDRFVVGMISHSIAYGRFGSLFCYSCRGVTQTQKGRGLCYCHYQTEIV